MAIEIGVAYLSIVPSTRGMIRDIKHSLNKDGGKASTLAGRNMGANMAKAMGQAFEKADPFDHMRTSADKSRAEVNKFAQDVAKASGKMAAATDKVRLANMRLGEALNKGRTSQSTLLNLQQQLKRANQELAESEHKHREASARRGVQISDLAKRQRDLAHATALAAEADKVAARSRQGILDRFRSWRRGEATGGNIVVGVDVDGNDISARRKVEQITRELSDRYKVHLDVDVDRGVLRAVANRIRNTFRSSPVAGFQDALAGVAGMFGSIAKKIAGLVPGTWVILGTLAAIGVTTFGPLLASMTQVLGLLAAIPAAATAAASAIAAIVAGSLGVFKALGAGMKAQPKGGAAGAGNGRQLERAQKQAARAAADSARQIADAERGLARAQRDARKAQEDLSEARREAAKDIEDLNARLQESQLDEEGAILGVRRAYENLREVMGSGDSSALDKSEARHSYKESIARLERTRKENKELAEQVEETNRAGVEGHDRVVDAQERVEAAAESVADAQRGVEDAVRSAARANEDAAESMADAAVAGGAGAAAVDEYAEAMANLSPSARQFVETVLSLRDAWGEVRLATQEALFKGMGPAFERFTNTYVPILSGGLSGIAGEFNAGFLRMFDDLERSGVTASWTAIFANLAEATGPFLDGIRNIAEAFTDMTLIASGYFPEIAGHFEDWTAGIRNFINEKPEKVHEWIQDGIEAFGRLKTTAGLVLDVIHAIFSPSTPEGDKMWDSINETLESWKESLGKKENRDALLNFFSEAKTLASDIKDIIEFSAKLARFLGRFHDGGLIGDRGLDESGEPKPTKVGGWWDRIKSQTSIDLPGGHNVGLFGGYEGPGIPFGGGGAGGDFGDKDGGRKVMGASMSGGTERVIPEGGPEVDGATAWGALTDPSNWADQFAIAGASISETWNSVVNPVKDSWNTGWETAGLKFGEFKTGASTKWSELSTNVRSFYDTNIKPTLDRFGGDTGNLQNVIGIATGVMRGDWGSVSSNLTELIDRNMGPAMDRLGGFADRVKTRFHDTVEGIKTKWGELKGSVASVINWIIRNVWNAGFVRAWSKAREFLPLAEAKEMDPIPGYATGGRVDGKGTATSDSILARLSRGEHVWDAMDVRRAGGHGTVYAIRALIERGQPFSWDAVEGLAARGKRGIRDFAAGRGDAGLPGFARGGAVDAERPMWMQQLERGHAFARAQDGKPYLAGNQFPAGADCSGFMAAVAGVITDDNPRAHWTTVAFPAGQAASVIAAGQRWNSGLGPGMSIGMSGGPASGGQNGHTAGTLQAVGPYSATNIESGGGHGRVAYGGPAVGADHSQFGTQYHLAIGADGAFESAGGPSPEAQKGVLRKLLEEIFGKVISPVGSAIDNGFDPPPAIDAVPGAAFDAMSDGIREETFGVVDSLGETLRSVYDKARGIKDIVGNVVSSVVGGIPYIKRDTGGVLPLGRSMVLNETGKPEQILNWDQIETIQGVMRDAMRLVRDLGAQFDRKADAELIANAIGRRLDETDWEAVAFRLDAFGVTLDKTLRTAGDSYADDALGVFGLRNGRKRLEDYMAVGKLLSGESDVAGVPNPGAVIGGDYSFSRQLPHIESNRQALETKLPALESASGGGGGGVKDAVKAQFAKYGWDKEPFWSAVDFIVGKESSWNPLARNPKSGAFSLFQFLGGTKAQYLPDESTDPSTQGAAGARYIKDRYGDPLKAKAFWDQNGWYDKGGRVKPGRTLVQNDSRKDELILNNSAWHDMSDTVSAAARLAELVPAGAVVGGSREGDTINLYTNDTDNAIRAFRIRDAQKAQARVGLR